MKHCDGPHPPRGSKGWANREPARSHIRFGAIASLRHCLSWIPLRPGDLNVGDDAYLKSTRIAARQAHSLHGIDGKVDDHLDPDRGADGQDPACALISRRLRRRGTFRPRDFTITEPALRQAFDQGLRRFFVREPYQQPLQIDLIILSTFASSRSMTGLVPRSGPF